MHCDGAHFLTCEFLHELVGAALRPDEDQSQSVRRVDVLHERLDLGVGRDGNEAVLDLSGLLLFSQRRLEAGGAVRVVPGQLADRAVERGREEHGLTIARQPVHDAVDLRLKAHVEHSVGFVEDEYADVR